MRKSASIYTGKVKRVMDFGAFVEIIPGTEGLLHISQISEQRIAKVTDEINEGDEVMVKVIEVDKLGRIRLSRKEAMGEKELIDRTNRLIIAWPGEKGLKSSPFFFSSQSVGESENADMPGLFFSGLKTRRGMP